MKNLYLILFLISIYSCKKDDIQISEVSEEPCVASTIPCPVIIGEEKEGCVANIIFLAEGFTETEIPEFQELSEIAKQAILDMEPFTSSSDRLNFYRVDSPSVTSGIRSIQYTSECNGTTGVNTTSETPWSVFSNKIGLKRLVGMDSINRINLEKLYRNYATGDYAYTIIIANTEGYYGGAEFPGVTEYDNIDKPKVSNMIVSKYDSGRYFKYLIRHEFGHSFGNMDDEYVDTGSRCALEEQPWFIETEPKPNVLTYNPGSWFEGARYVPTGYWREWENSIMRTKYDAEEFSPVQERTVKQRLEAAIGCP